METDRDSRSETPPLRLELNEGGEVRSEMLNGCVDVTPTERL